MTLNDRHFTFGIFIASFSFSHTNKVSCLFFLLHNFFYELAHDSIMSSRAMYGNKVLLVGFFSSLVCNLKKSERDNFLLFSWLWHDNDLIKSCCHFCSKCFGNIWKTFFKRFWFVLIYFKNLNCNLKFW